MWRGDNKSGELHDFTVEVNDGEVVLDIIHRLQATQELQRTTERAPPRRQDVPGDPCPWSLFGGRRT